MAFRSSLVLVLYAIHAGAAKTTLSAELTSLLPVCAHTCFTSFLDFNFALTKCGINPALDCLCTTKSTSEYTVGEGAVQCVLSTVACTQGGAPDSAAFKAYTMCDGKKGSLPNTHATLTATLVVDSSTVSSSGTALTSTSKFSASTTLPITTDSSILPSTLITTTPLPRPSTTNSLPATSTSTSSGTASTAIAATSGPLLTKNQTVGISVGSSVAALAIIGLIIFACLRRRKYQRSRDSDMLPFQLDPSNDQNYGHGYNNHAEKKIKGPGGTTSGVARKIPPRIPIRVDTQSPNMFSRKSLKPDMIGVAISPDKQRRASRLLPEKPTLTLTVPEGSKSKVGLSYPTGSAGVSAYNSRQSTTTQFEEDFDSADTAVAADDSWGRGSNDLLHPPPQQKASAKIPEPNPRVPAFMIVGRAQQAEIATALPIASEFMVKPLQITRNGQIGSFSQPRKPDDYPSRVAQNLQQQAEATGRQQLQVVVPPQPQTQSSPPRPTTSTSSVYTNTSIAGSDAGLPPVTPRNARRSYRASGPYDKPGHQSNGSLTSFETVDSVVISPTNVQVPQPPIITRPSDSSTATITTINTSSSSGSESRKPVLAPIITSNSLTASKSIRRQTATNLDLSPVVESPSSRASGKSPVSYPKIPARGRLPEHTIRMVPPPAQPDFNSVFHSGRYANNGKGLNYEGVSPEIISPIVASPTPIENSTAITPGTERNMKPWRVAEIKAQRERERKEKEPTSAIEPMSAVEIEIGMLTPAMPEHDVLSQNNAKLQPFLAGTGRIWPEQYEQGGYAQQQQRRPQQNGNGQERYLAPSAHFNPAIPQSQGQQQHRGQNQQKNQQPYHNNPQQYKTPLQQQLQSSYQAYNPTQNQTRPQNRSQTQTQGGRTLSPNPASVAINSTSQGTHTRSSSVSSTTSSLLAKRRGEQKEKALALNLSQNSKPSSNSSSSKPAQDKWRVLNADEKEAAKQGAWRPKLGEVEREKDGRVVLGMRGEVGSGGGLGSGLLGTGGLPRTPGWVPKLTPTRRGDELFLSVA